MCRFLLFRCSTGKRPSAKGQASRKVRIDAVGAEAQKAVRKEPLMYPVIRMIKELIATRNAEPLSLTGTH
ncbi:MAG: hypothetical protein OQK00_09610, partial [Rhodobacteraceae bacterium]|nr:hypothetical protein [Paracoccaceae bacterium]